MLIVNSRPAGFPGGGWLSSLGVNHQWIATSSVVSAGMSNQYGAPDPDTPLGPWIPPFNDCNSFCRNVVDSSTPGPWAPGNTLHSLGRLDSASSKTGLMDPREIRYR